MTRRADTVCVACPEEIVHEKNAKISRKTTHLNDFKTLTVLIPAS